MRKREHHCVCRRPGDGEATLPVPSQSDRLGERQRVASSGLLFGRSYDPDVIAECSCDRLEQLQASGVHAIVVGEKDAHGSAMPFVPQWGNLDRACDALMRHIRNSRAISSLAVRKFLFSQPRVFIGAFGDKRLSHKLRESQCYLPPAAPLAGRSQRQRFGLFRNVGRTGPVRGRDYGYCTCRPLRRRRFRTF